MPQKIWNVSIDHHKVGEMFIVCGVLYAVDSVSITNTKIRFALDLYKDILLDVNLSFSNPFRKTTMIGYNHRNKVKNINEQIMRIWETIIDFRSCTLGTRAINWLTLWGTTKSVTIWLEGRTKWRIWTIRRLRCKLALNYMFNLIKCNIGIKTIL